MAGCASDPPADETTLGVPLADATATTSTTSTSTTTTSSTSTSTVPTTSTVLPTTTITTAPAPVTSAPSAFRYSIHPVTAGELAHSWHEGCPVPTEDLRRIDLVHHDFSGGIRKGSIVVHRRYADDIARVFGGMFDAGYPMVSVVPIGVLPEGAEDQPGYENTSAFHCRFVAGTTRWSEHATGSAIDINVHLNPYHRGDYLWPAGSERYLDRSLGEPGMIVEGDAVVNAFDDIGWGWGGRWRSSKDYQHFSASGR